MYSLRFIFFCWRNLSFISFHSFLNNLYMIITFFYIYKISVTWPLFSKSRFIDWFFFCNALICHIIYLFCQINTSEILHSVFKHNSTIYLLPDCIKLSKAIKTKLPQSKNYLALFWWLFFFQIFYNSLKYFTQIHILMLQKCVD